MAEEIPESSQAPDQSPLPNVNQPSNQAPPTVEYYERIVNRAHEEIKWVQDKYKLAAIIVGFIALAGITVLGLYIPKTVSNLKQEIKDEAATTRLTIQQELNTNKEKAVNELTTHLNKQIAEQFGTQRIQETLKRVAETEAKGIIDKEVKPVVGAAKKFVGSFRDDYNKKIEDLGKEVEFQKQVRKILDLQSSAVLNCDLQAFRILQEYNNESEELRRAASSAILAIKLFLNNQVWLYGSNMPIRNMPTDELIQRLPSSNSRDRSAIAEELMSRKECNVPEALLELINSDESLCVRHSASVAFNTVTLFQTDDFLVVLENSNKP